MVVAEVGDADLARNGKPIVKQLYKEHPEVAKLTAEKVGGGILLARGLEGALDQEVRWTDGGVMGKNSPARKQGLA